MQRDGIFTQVFNVSPKHVAKVKVYSVQVDVFHTYCVGKTGILVRSLGTKLAAN